MSLQVSKNCGLCLNALKIVANVAVGDRLTRNCLACKTLVIINSTSFDFYFFYERLETVPLSVIRRSVPRCFPYFCCKLFNDFKSKITSVNNFYRLYTVSWKKRGHSILRITLTNLDNYRFRSAT